VNPVRQALLAASTSVWLRERATRARFVRRSVARFMPGERFEDAAAAARRQQAEGIGTVFTRLGENVATAEEAALVAAHYLDVLDRIAAERLDAQISIKPTQLGLDLEPGLCARHLEQLVDRAGALGGFVWIDMEGSRYVEPTLTLFRRVRARSARVGVCLQAYLRRTPGDVEALLPLGCAIRLVKGAYLEPPAVAWPDRRTVDESFYRLACRLLAPDALAAGTLLHLGTHDPVLARRLNAVIDERQIPPSAYEYAMLYGIQRPLQQRLAAEGRRVRVLVAYGEYWFPWYMRRLAERPANVWFVVKNLLAR